MAVRQTHINLEEDVRASLVISLNRDLANTIFAMLAAKFAHWNVKGTGFFPAHQLFDKVFEFYTSAMDIIGERITALGGTAEGLLGDVSLATQIDYSADDNDDVSTHMKAMAEMLGQVSNGYRLSIKAMGAKDLLTQDVYIELGREAEKLLYFLEADLRKF